MALLVCSMMSALIPAMTLSLLKPVLIEQVTMQLVQVLIALFVVLVLNALIEQVMMTSQYKIRLLVQVQVEQMHYHQMTTIRLEKVNIHLAVVVQLHLNAIVKTCVKIRFFVIYAILVPMLHLSCFLRNQPLPHCSLGTGVPGCVPPGV